MEAVDDVVPVFIEGDVEAFAAGQAISAAESQSFIHNFIMLVRITNHKSTLRQGNRNVLVTRLEVGINATQVPRFNVQRGAFSRPVVPLRAT